MATLIQTPTFDPDSSDQDEIVLQLQKLSIEKDCKDSAPRSNSISTIAIKELTPETSDNELSPKDFASPKKPLEVNDKATVKKTTEDNANNLKPSDEPSTSLNKLEKDSQMNASSFERNLYKEDDTSDENNESSHTSDNEDDRGLINDKDSNAKDQKDKMNANDPENKFIKRGPISHGHCYPIQRFNPISNSTKTFASGYGGTNGHLQNGYNEIIPKQNELQNTNLLYHATQYRNSLNKFDNCNAPANANFSFEFNSLGDFKPLVSNEKDQSNYIHGDGYLDCSKQNIGSIGNSNMPSHYTPVTMNENFTSQIPLDGLQDGYNNLPPILNNFSNNELLQQSDSGDIWNEPLNFYNNNGSPVFQYQPPTPPKSVSPNPKNQDSVNDELIELLTVINESSQDDNPLIGHEEMVRNWKKAVQKLDCPVPNETYSQRDDCATSNYDFMQHSFDINDLCETAVDVRPTEMDVYLYGKKDENPTFDFTNAEEEIWLKCDPQKVEELNRRISRKSEASLTEKDYQGDSPLAIIISKNENDEGFYETIYCLQQRVKKIRFCCDKLVKKCKSCRNISPDKLYSPLSFKNWDGDTPLSCSVKMRHSDIVINYLLSGLLQCPEDVRRVFDEEGKKFYASVLSTYPIFKQFLK